MFNVTVMGVCPSSLKSLKFCNRFLPILRLRSSSHTSFRHKLSLDFTARDIEQKSNPNLHTQKNFVICDIVFVIFVDHSFVERARARSARAPKISSAFLNLGARSARDFKTRARASARAQIWARVPSLAKYHYLKFLLIRIFIWMFVLIKFLIFTFFSRWWKFSFIFK